MTAAPDDADSLRERRRASGLVLQPGGCANEPGQGSQRMQPGAGKQATRPVADDLGAAAQKAPTSIRAASMIAATARQPSPPPAGTSNWPIHASTRTGTRRASAHISS
jgi:hypothetical protein